MLDVRRAVVLDDLNDDNLEGDDSIDINNDECRKLIKTIKKNRGDINRFYQKKSGIHSSELTNQNVQYSYNLIKAE